MQNYLKQLNSAQKAVVQAIKGPVMVIAGAGAGKTRVLTYRIAYLMDEKDVSPFNILVLTFTNKAALEMKKRIGKIVGYSESRNLWMGTFHSVFARILRIEGSYLGYPKNFSIYDSEDTVKAISNVIKAQNLDKQIYKPKSVARRISAFKNALITPKEYFQSPDLKAQDNESRMPQIGEVFQAYNEKNFRAGVMDFDDLLLNTYFLLRKFPELLNKYQDCFRYIMVDEYQDTNHIQYLIVKALANRHGNICVVGDDAQSIYAFRGGNIKNILNYQRDYDDVGVFKLEQNYRSTKNIVGAANSLISKNRDQFYKEIWTNNHHGERIILHKAVSDSDEGNYAARVIFEKQLYDKVPYKGFAILYRTNAQSRVIEETLRRKNIPYRIYGGLSFYQRKEVKDLLAYFRLAVNQKDEEAFRRVINYPKRGIGDTTIEKLIVLANRKSLSLWEASEKMHSQLEIGINQSAIMKIRDFLIKIKSYKILSEKSDAFAVAAHIAKTSGLLHELSEDKTPEGMSRYQNIQELLNSVKGFTENQRKTEEGNPSLPAFMQYATLLTNVDNDDPSDSDRVSLMTIHLAKGLEFPIVFILGMEENLFPSMMSVSNQAELEEERRLFYVALTRAEKEAHLTYTQMRYRWGKFLDCEPSRFLEEIDERFLNIKTPEFRTFTDSKLMKRTRNTTFTSGNLLPSREKNLQKVNRINDSSNYKSLTDISVGEKVKHQHFGPGKIKSIEGHGPSKKVTIEFENVGEKKLLLKFAKLGKI